MRGTTATLLGLILVLSSAAQASSFAELRRLAASLPADDWFYESQLEVGYARPIPVEGLNAGWLALSSPRVGGLRGIVHFESVQAPFLRDQRYGAGAQAEWGAGRIGILVMRRGLHIASQPGWFQRSVRASLRWSEGRWDVGGQFDVDLDDSTVAPPQLSVGLEDSQWRLRVLRRSSPYELVPIWEGGFEIRPTRASAVALRLGQAAASLGVRTRHGGWSLRLSTALDGARAGGLSLVVARP